MKKNYPYIMITLILSICTMAVNSQETFSAIGGEATGNGGNVSYAIGQICFSNPVGINGFSCIEGVEQPYEISLLETSNTIASDEIDLSFYPNPVNQKLTIQYPNFKNIPLHGKLVSLQGKTLILFELCNKVTDLSMSQLPASIYILVIGSKNQTIKTYKIIKKPN